MSGPAAGEAGRALIDQLGLRPHPEGGWYRETWRAALTVTPPGFPGPRAAATGIQFLLPPGETSRWHRVRSDELWLWQGLGPLRLRLGGTGPGPDEDAATELPVGPNPAAGQLLQALVPAGVWQSAAPTGPDGALVACVVAPGFDFADFELLV